MEIIVEIDLIIGKALEKAERRIRERQSDVLVRELNEARKDTRKELIEFTVSLGEVLRKVKEAEALKKFYTNIPKYKGDRKSLGDIVSEHREREKSDKK